jgi:hypothetical protein
MATFSLVRDTKLYISTAQDVLSMGSANTWEVPILAGYSFTAETDVQTVTVSEAGIGNVARGQQAFTNAIQPVNWSITTYMRPRWFAASPAHADAVERVLWEGLAGPKDANTINTTTDGTATTMGASQAGMVVDFLQSNVNELLPLSLVFKIGGIWYHITGALVNQAEIDFSIDSIAQIAWSGFGTELQEIADPGWTTADYLEAPATYACIRNKLSTVELTNNASGGSTYTVALTGGSLTINNNIEFLTPEVLGTVNRPCGGFTGTREVSGNLTAYLKAGATATAGLLNDLSTDLSTVTQDFALKIHAGNGTSTTTHVPQVQFDLPHTHINIPTVNVEDVLSVDIGFTALPTDGTGEFDLEFNNELVVTYFPDES